MSDELDEFAMAALPAILSTYSDFSHPDWRVGVALDAYSMAQAMLTARAILLTSKGNTNDQA